LAAHVFREHGVAGSRPAAETSSATRALGRGRSSMAELRDVTPPVPVRLRPVTPKRMCRPCVANSSGRVPGSYPGRSGFEPLAAHQSRTLVAEQADAPVSETGARRACPFDSDRGDHLQQSGSSAAEQRPHKAKAGGSCPPRTTKHTYRRGVVEWPQTAGFEPVHTGSNPVAPATTSSLAQRQSNALTKRRSTFRNRQELPNQNPDRSR
jgi:hypothetical protein